MTNIPPLGFMDILDELTAAPTPALVPPPGLVPSGIVACLAEARRWDGQHEIPAGSNRSPFIDSLADEFGEPRGLAWCARFAGHCRKKAKLWIPSHDVGSCDEWVYQAKKAGKWSATPVPGAAVIFRSDKKFTTGRYAGQFDAIHVELVVEDVTHSIGGNTSKAGFNSNGGMVCEKRTAGTVYGYVLP